MIRSSSNDDEGICLTKNLNFKDLIEFSEEFTNSFETNNDEKPLLITGDLFKAEATFIINTNAKDQTTKTFSRSGPTSGFDELHERRKEMGKVFFWERSSGDEN